MRLLTLLLTLLAVSAIPAHSLALTIVTEPDSPPSSMIVDGILTGSSVEIVKEIQKRVGDTSAIEVLPWARAYHIATSMPDVLLFSALRLPEREDLFHWVGPILHPQWGFYALKGKVAPISSLEEAKKFKSIGTYRNDSQEIFLKSHGFTNLDSATTVTVSAKKVASGMIDVFVSKDISLAYTLASAGIPEESIENVYNYLDGSMYLVFSKGTDLGTVKTWEKALQDMKDDGTFAAIYAKWYPGLIPPQ
jgi:polar amino acid transport system substrate-binding protein